MDLNGVESVNFTALGGADTITVNDLTGTDVTEVNLDLAASPARRPATARPTPSSSTAPTATTSSRSFGDASGVAVLGLAARSTSPAPRRPTTG